jgi:hypothetical protein
VIVVTVAVVELSQGWIEATWTGQLAVADVIEASTLLYVVAGDHDLDNVEMGYLPPNGYELRYDLLHRVGEERLHEDHGLHRFAIFQAVRDGPLGGFAAMLRHELRHAEQFHRYGPGLFELDGHLREALDVHARAAERERYESLPTEYDANKTAAEYARDHHADELEQMAADERLALYARNDYDDRADDLLAATLQALDEHVDPESLWNGNPVTVDIANQTENACEWAARDRTSDRFNLTRGDRPGVVFV